MTLLRPLFFAALLAGLLAGGASTVLHHLDTVPLILQAETYEAAPAADHSHAHGDGASPLTMRSPGSRRTDWSARPTPCSPTC